MHRQGWNDVYQHLRLLDWRTPYRVPKHSILHPSRVEGFVRSTGINKGQLEDWRLSLEGGAGLHVHVFDDRYEAHLDEVDPSVDLVEHLRQDAPEIYTFLSVGMSAYVASKLSSNPNAPVIGGFLGAFLAMSSVEQARKDNAARYRPPVLRIRRR